jgi:hypothetical protein
MRFRFCSRFIIPILACAARVTASSATDLAIPSTQADNADWLQTAKANWNTVKRFMIEYESITTAGSGGPPVHGMLAVAEPGDYHHLGAHFSADVPWQADPFCQELFVHAGKATHNWPFNRSYQEQVLKEGDNMPGSTPRMILFPVIPHWPLTEYKIASNPQFGCPSLLSDALQLDSYHPVPGLEQIEGENCVVVELEGLDRIWFARDKGLCVIKRELFDAQSHSLRMRILTSATVQIAPGLWFPQQLRIQFFNAESSPSSEGMFRESTIKLTRWAINDDVPNALFLPVHEPGSISWDQAQHWTQTSAGGEDLLDQFVQFMIQNAHLPSQGPQRSYPTVWLLFGVVAGAMLRWAIGGTARRSTYSAPKLASMAASADQHPIRPQLTKP